MLSKQIKDLPGHRAGVCSGNFDFRNNFQALTESGGAHLVGWHISVALTDSFLVLSASFWTYWCESGVAHMHHQYLTWNF
jgi:hypothetical protein